MHVIKRMHPPQFGSSQLVARLIVAYSLIQLHLVHFVARGGVYELKARYVQHKNILQTSIVISYMSGEFKADHTIILMAYHGFPLICVILTEFTVFV